MMQAYFRSSIGRKTIMAVTGFFLLGFVIAHMLGNLQIFLGQNALNDYAKHLEELPYLLYSARIFLLICVLLHIWTAISLTRENRAARPKAYKVQATVQATYASRTMMMSGIIVLAFIIYHLLHFSAGVAHPEYFKTRLADGNPDVYNMVVRSFQQWPISLVYIFSMALLCLHLSHGIQSIFQTLGFEKMRPKMQWPSRLFALAIFLGNSSIPLACLLGWVK